MQKIWVENGGIVDTSDGLVVAFGTKFSIFYDVREIEQFVCLGIHDDGETALLERLKINL